MRLAGDIETLASQRVDGQGRLSVARGDGRTRIARLHQGGAAKIRFPAVAGDPLEAVLINTAGGLTGGDRLAWRAEAGPGAALTLTTQACEKVYRSGSGGARLQVELSAGPGGRIAWLPQETIVYDRSALARRLDADIAADAELLLVEATLFGRRAMGEQVRQALFRDRWRVHVGGRLVHAEAVGLGPQMETMLAGSAAAGGGLALATVLLVGRRAEAMLPAVRNVVGPAGGASAWTVGGTGKLLARLVAGDGYGLRERLVPLVALLNGAAGLPKVWSL